MSGHSETANGSSRPGASGENEGRAMVRAFFCVVWSVIFFVVASIGTSLAVAHAAGKDPAKQQAAAQKAGREMGPPILLGSIGLGVLGAVVGVLPGTGKRTRVAVETVSNSLLMAQPSYDPRTAHAAPRVAATEHHFTFAGFLDRWGRILGAVPFFGLIAVFFAANAKDPKMLQVAGAFFLIPVGVVLFVTNRFLLVRRVQVDPEGVTWSGVLGSSFRPWDQVKTVWRENSILNRRYRTQRVSLKFAGGGSVSFDQALTDFNTLAASIQEATGRVLLPLYRERLGRDGEARFGQVTLRPDGLTMQGKFFAWDAISRFDLINGHLTLFKRPRPKSHGDRAVPLREIPNHHVLLELLGDSGVPWTSEW